MKKLLVITWLSLLISGGISLCVRNIEAAITEVTIQINDIYIRRINDSALATATGIVIPNSDSRFSGPFSVTFTPTASEINVQNLKTRIENEVKTQWKLL